MGRSMVRDGMGRMAGGDDGRRDGGGSMVEEDEEDEEEGKCRRVCSRMYACMPSSVSSCSVDSADTPAVEDLVEECDGERIMAMTGNGVEVKVLKRVIRSSVPASWAGKRSEGVSSRKSWWTGGDGGGASGCCLG